MAPADRQRMIKTTSVGNVSLPRARVKPVTGMMLTCERQ